MVAVVENGLASGHQCQQQSWPASVPTGDPDGSTSQNGGRSCPQQRAFESVRHQEDKSVIEPFRKQTTASTARVLGRGLVAIMIVAVNFLAVGRLVFCWRTRVTAKVSTVTTKRNQAFIIVGAGGSARPKPNDNRGGSMNEANGQSNRTSEFIFNGSRTFDAIENESVSSGAREEGPARRVPKRSPHHVYQCGYYKSTALVNALFPDANATNLQHETPAGRSVSQLIQSFRRDDVLLVTCNGPCVIPLNDLPSKFPGPILHVTGEPSLRLCPLSSLQLRKAYNASTVTAFQRRITSLTRIGSDRGSWNESTFNAALLVASNEQPSERDKILRPEKRPTNTGKHFLIYANSHCVPFREEAFRRLSTVGPDVHYVGRCNGGGNATGQGGGAVVRVKDNPKRHGYGKNKILYHDYRFTLAMENAVVPGYITEKILLPFLAGSIPIYYGTREVFDIFNRDAFVWYDVDDPTPALEQITRLEANRTAYEAMLRQPILARGEETLAKYFSVRDEDGGGRLKWAIRDRIGFG